LEDTRRKGWEFRVWANRGKGGKKKRKNWMESRIRLGIRRKKEGGGSE